MSVSYTYSSLRDALISTTEERSTGYASALDNIIALAESKLLRDLNLELFDVTSTGTFTATNPLLSKPSGMVALRSLHYTDANGNENLIESKSWEYIKDYWPKSSTTTSSPKFVADYNLTQWYLAGTPASNLAYTVRYIKRPAGLSSGNTSTWLSTTVGDLLFFACLMGSEQYLKADPRIEVWKKEYNERLPAVRMEVRRDKRDDYAPVTGTPDANPQ